MVGLVIAIPGIVSGGLAKKAPIDTDKIEIRIPDTGSGAEGSTEDAMQRALDKAMGGGGSAAGKSPGPAAAPADAGK